MSQLVRRFETDLFAAIAASRSRCDCLIEQMTNRLQTTNPGLSWDGLGPLRHQTIADAGSGAYEKLGRGIPRARLT